MSIIDGYRGMTLVMENKTKVFANTLGNNYRPTVNANLDHITIFTVTHKRQRQRDLGDRARRKGILRKFRST